MEVMAQAEKAALPMLFTEFGIVMEVRLRHALKVTSAILFKELDSVIDSSREQAAYLYITIYQYFQCKTVEKWSRSFYGRQKKLEI